VTEIYRKWVAKKWSKIGTKKWSKSQFINVDFGGQKRSKFDDKKVTQKVVKNDRFWRVKKWVENGQKMSISGGGPGGPKTSKIDLGGTGPQIWNFLKFCSFVQKLPHFSTPKMTPIKMFFPTNRLCSGQKIVKNRWTAGGPHGPKNVETPI
jgi:hypothetical protein